MPPMNITRKDANRTVPQRAATVQAAERLERWIARTSRTVAQMRDLLARLNEDAISVGGMQKLLAHLSPAERAELRQLYGRLKQLTDDARPDVEAAPVMLPDNHTV